MADVDLKAYIVDIYIDDAVMTIVAQFKSTFIPILLLFGTKFETFKKNN
jgi:hypothetical protein